MNSVNIKEKFSKFSKNWHPHQIAIADDMQVLLAKIKGEFVSHQHEKEDELFQVIKGTLEMHFRDRIEIINKGEIIVVPKEVEHCPVKENGEEVHVLLLEKLSTAHTGTIKHEKTISNYPKN